MNENEKLKPIRVRVLISGNVQGVCFRSFVKEKTKDLELSGWVQNLNGINKQDKEIRLVEAVFQGTPENVDKMLDLCKKGNPSSGETKVKELHRYPPKNPFEILVI